MEIRDFYTHLIELARPWTVKAVIVEDGLQRVDVHLECGETAQFPCPHCDLCCTVSGYSPARIWRHLDTCRRTTWLHARLPVVYCPEHGKQYPHIPWADTGSPMTRAFEQSLARLVENFGDIKKAAHFAGMDPDQIRGFIRHASQKTGKVKNGPDRAETISQASPGSQACQLSLFGRHNDVSLVNQGIRAFKDLELEKAVDLFEKHRDIYPRGYDVSSWLSAARFLLLGIGEAPNEPRERPGYLCRLWNSFEDRLEPGDMNRDTIVADVKPAFFARVIENAEKSCPAADSLSLAGGIPLGYILLQAGRHEEAIRSLQNCIVKMPHDAAIYGYLGDAYWLSGKPGVARQCYREGCLIDPASIDWRHLLDEDLKELKRDISFKYGSDSALALAWLPSHARIEGLFERKVIRLHDGLKEMVHDYLDLNKAISKGESSCLRAKLFFRGMILCENHENLKFIKTIDLIDVRRMMKQSNPDLFEEFLELIAGGRG